MGRRALILLDTQAMLWLDLEPERIGAEAADQVHEASRLGTLAFSVTSLWEVGTLLRRRRIELDVDLAGWRAEWLAEEVLEVDLDAEIVLRADALSDFHPDPADRFITATAPVHGATLITADERILDWPGPVRRLDARR